MKVVVAMSKQRLGGGRSRPQSRSHANLPGKEDRLGRVRRSYGPHVGQMGHGRPRTSPVTRKRRPVTEFERMRMAAGFSQQELARRLHVSQGAVSAWERGLTAPGDELYPRLAELLGVASRKIVDVFHPDEKGDKQPT
jgi:DNA-binding XRE family transcriptional regulator